MKSLYKNLLSLIILCVFAITGCIKEEENIDFVPNKDIVIDINTTRTVGNILGTNSNVEIMSRKSAVIDSSGNEANSDIMLRASASDPFTEIREVECWKIQC